MDIHVLGLDHEYGKMGKVFKTFTVIEEAHAL
jgi:hypothetical protein